MAFKVLFLRGTAEENNTYTGLAGEITLDMENRALRIHDGEKEGGFPILGADDVDAKIQEVADRVDANEASISDINDLISTIQDELDDRIHVDQMGVADGVATLNGEGKVPTEQIPDAVLGQLEYQGVWNPDTNTPELPSTPEQKGDYYIAEAPGSFADMDFETGDWLVAGETEWQKVNNTDAVRTVNGKKGDVVLDKTDIGLDQVDNTSDADKPVSTAQQAALDEKADLASATFVEVQAPTRESGDDTTHVATTAFVQDAVTTATGELDTGVVTVNGRDGEVTLTAEDVNLGDVENHAMATEQQAIDADTMEAYMSPQRTRDFVEGIGFEQDEETGEWTLDMGTIS